MEGNLVDGQHRMEAVVAAGKPIVSIVVQPVDGDLCIDIGARRQLRDYLAKHGASDFPGECAVVLKDLAIIQKGYSMRGSNRAVSGLLTNPALNDLWRAEKDNIVAAVARLAPAIERLGKSMTTICATAYMLFSVKDKAVADEFASVMIGTATFPPSDMFTVLFDQYLRELQKPRKASRGHYLAYAIMAWNKRRAGFSGVRLSWSRKQEFPTVE